MNLLDALLLGVVEGVTEFLPVSSTGHLTIVEKLLGLSVDDPGVTAFTAIIQVGAIIAVIVHLRNDIRRFVRAWFGGLTHRSARGSDYRLAWYVIIASVPIGVVGYLSKDVVTGGLRSLWVVVVALVVWSVVMWAAERVGSQTRTEEQTTSKDAVVIGLLQCVALIPGVSRSGATISAGLFVGLNRVAATRLSFFLSIPALVAAGGYEAATQADAISATVGWGPTLLGTVVSFVVALAATAWLLQLVSRYSITVFIWYRVGLAALVTLLLLTGVITAT